MSLHQKITMSKSQSNIRSGQLSFPAISIGGLVVRLCWRPPRWLRLFGQHRVGEMAYMGHPTIRQHPNAILFQFFDTPTQNIHQSPVL